MRGARWRSPMTPRLLSILLLVACTRGANRLAPDAAAPAEVVVARFARPAFSPPTEGTPRRGGTLRVGMESEPARLDPLLDRSAWADRVAMRSIYEGLLRPQTGGFVPDLAERHEVTAAGRIHTFWLRRGVRWHDGRAFGPDDVVFTIERLLDPKVGAEAMRADLAGLVRAVRVGEDGVRLEFERALFSHAQALAALPILPRHVFATGPFDVHPAQRAPVGTGPFRFERWTAGQEIVLVRHDGYHDPLRAAHLDRVVFKVARDRTLLWELLRKGEIDFLYRLTPEQQQEVHAGVSSAAGKLRALDWLGTDYVFFAWNTRKPPLDDARVRRALTLLIDRPSIVPKVTRGFAVPISGPHWIATDAYDRTIAPWPFDPTRGGAELDAAGFRRRADGQRARGDQPLRITLLVPAGSRVTEQLAILAQADLARAGVTLELAPVEWSLFTERVRTRAFEGAAYLYNNDLEQDLWPVFHSSQAAAGLNASGIADPELDGLLEQVRAAAPAARLPLQHRVHARLHELAPMTFWFTSAQTAAMDGRLRGVYPSVPFFPLRDVWWAR